jgi:hypothetical protein
VPAKQERLSCRVELRESLTVLFGPMLRRLIAPEGWIDRLRYIRRWRNCFRGWVGGLLTRLRDLICGCEAAQIIAPTLLLSSVCLSIFFTGIGRVLDVIPRRLCHFAN